MFSYRHAFHAGNHADVLKHLVLMGTLQHLLQKDTPLTVIDTHAGAGLYRLDGDYANTSGEAGDGIYKLPYRPNEAPAPVEVEDFAIKSEANLLNDYLRTVASFNPTGAHHTAPRVYPGSPLIAHHLLRPQDRLRLFELHPTDHKSLTGHVEQLPRGVHITVAMSDGFESLRAQLPPPAAAGGSKRALVLIDPSYEIKTDYARVQSTLQEALKRFSTGVYLIWYPIIPRPEAHDLPRRLKALCQSAGKPWLHTTLCVGAAPAPTATVDRDGRVQAKPRGGLNASGVWVVNPPHTLAARLRDTLPQVLTHLARGTGKSWHVESHP